jgi:hypothetical protein
MANEASTRQGPGVSVSQLTTTSTWRHTTRPNPTAAVMMRRIRGASVRATAGASEFFAILALFLIDFSLMVLLI